MNSAKAFNETPGRNGSSNPPAVRIHTCTDAMCVSLVTSNAIIMVLGMTGNALVIWMAGFRMKKRVNTVWYLSLAVADFLYCAFLPLSIIYVATGEWIFGRFMCKFLPSFLFLNWFSSISILLLISVDRCIVVMFPVWAHNKRTVHRAWVMVVAAWVVSALLSSPAAVFYDVETKSDSPNDCAFRSDHAKAVVLGRLVFLFVIPFLIIIGCYAVIIRKLKYNQVERSKKPFKVMTALVAAFFICWMPYHIFSLLETNRDHTGIGRSVGITLAGANSVLNPILYAFMGKDFCLKLRQVRQNSRVL